MIVSHFRPFIEVIPGAVDILHHDLETTGPVEEAVLDEEHRGVVVAEVGEGEGLSLVSDLD